MRAAPRRSLFLGAFLFALLAAASPRQAAAGPDAPQAQAGAEVEEAAAGDPVSAPPVSAVSRIQSEAPGLPAGRQPSDDLFQPPR